MHGHTRWRGKRIALALLLLVVGVVAVAALGGAVAWARGDIQRHLIARDLDAFYAAAGRGDLAAARRAYPLYADNDAFRNWITLESATHGPPLGVRIANIDVGGMVGQIGNVTFVVRYADGEEGHAIANWVANHPQGLPTHTIEAVVRACDAKSMPGDFGPVVGGSGTWTMPFTATDEAGGRRRYTAFLQGNTVALSYPGAPQATRCGAVTN